MSIEAISESPSSSSTEPEDKALLEYYGKFATTLALIIAISAAAPASFNKKKRTYTPQANPYATPLPSPSTSSDFLAISETPRVPTCSLQDRAKIKELFDTVAKETTLGLVMKRSYLQKLGDEVRHLHPFTFILALPKESIVQILQSGNPFKVSNIENGIKEGILRELERNQIRCYLKDFARKMDKNPRAIQSYIANHNWSKLINYLFLESVS